MKINAANHPKVMEFQSLLNVPKAMAIGYLELFWNFCAQHAPQGNVGKWKNAAIAIACEFQPQENQNLDSFVDALISARLVDPCETHRLLVHDWADHVPAWVKTQLKKSKLELATSSKSYQGADNKEDKCAPDARSSRTATSREGKGSEGKASEEQSHSNAQTGNAPRGKPLSMGMKLNIGWFQKAKAARPELTQEQVERSWGAFVNHHVAVGTCFVHPLAAWIQWIKNERAGNVVKMAAQARGGGACNPAESMSQVQPGLYEQSVEGAG